MLPMPLEEDHVAAVELKTIVPEGYAKFYNLVEDPIRAFF